ncbi:glycine oxidase ThiO [Terrihabitans rhizophilus]|uniref:Glycine oxidase ThiO n=1 Tax=Terrihabitans rhizophilus TaxID=3092662 RepID=A0ABU4RP14_9HYPH|nr:glycine oxidase ThiO [Terrihabitans sp. PJ23]MDX6805395.1 glycine oxidase ThiO [Terrihabitans sp. PJ23]
MTKIIKMTDHNAARRFDVAIIGGGIIGLSVGRSLLKRGLSVGVFERGVVGSGATRAASGMLAATAEVEPGEDDLLPLTLASQDLWHGFAKELEAETGLSVDYRAEGTMVVALSRDEVDRLRFRHQLQTRLGLKTDWLPGSAAREREPGLRPNVAGAILCEQDHQVDARLVAAALKAAFEAAGGALFENTAVISLERSGGRVTGLLTEAERVEAGTFVLAAGAWSPQLVPDLQIPVRPLRGQSMALRMDPRMPALTHVVWTEQIHMAPKGDGRLVIGATVEERGFDQRNTAGGVFALLEAARQALPSMEDLAIDEIWAGFRPTSLDDAPIFGEVGIDGLVVATGHHRNGILLAPVSARAISDLIAEGQMSGPEAAFTLQRFSRNTSRLNEGA